ncbi:MAG: hypothetical protein NTW19_14960 [Planctomycetota bacterium]|nr:hypothetical protein [Planctomycetota bacterium]
MKRRLMLLAAGLLAMVMAPKANADSVTAYLNNVNPAGTLSVSFDGGSSYDTTPYVGAINWTNVTTDTTNTAVKNFITKPGGFLSFCIEGQQNVYIHQNATWTLSTLGAAPNTSPMGTDRAARLTEFWGRHIAQVTDSLTAAAFQLAVWEIVSDSPASHVGAFVSSFVPSFTAGTTRAKNPNPAGIINLASSWITDSVNGLGGSASYANYQLYALSSPGLQDQIFGIQTVVVPVPASFPAGMACLAVMGVVAIRRRMKPLE